MTAGRTVLVVDDEASVRDLVSRYLTPEGFVVHTAENGEAALAMARQIRPDLIILDVMLPGMDGIEVLRRLREWSQVYVLLLTARTDETDKVVGLSVGADDYLTKPFSPRELVARAKAILRRGRGVPEPEAPLEFGRLRIAPGERRVWKDGTPVDLTSLEFDLLLALAAHPRLVFTREQLIQRVWGADFYGDERVVDVHIKELRKKLEDDPGRPAFITTVRGVGYRFEGR
ncbi:MAG: response regulator transcription factor [Armatimonadota bacterium]|nr:response regulator transcription factor [Armatimonadota bacterium]